MCKKISKQKLKERINEYPDKNIFLNYLDWKQRTYVPRKTSLIDYEVIVTTESGRYFEPEGLFKNQIVTDIFQQLDPDQQLEIKEEETRAIVLFIKRKEKKHGK